MLAALARWITKGRYRRWYEAHFRMPEVAQTRVWRTLLSHGRRTAYGRTYGLDPRMTPADFARDVPLVTYDELAPWVRRMTEGESSVLWPGKVRWFARSSGTASQRSKLIPVPPEMLRYGHFRGGKDMLMLYFRAYPRSRIIGGKILKLGGTVSYDPERGIYTGDLSGILIRHLPFWARKRSFPPQSLALLPDWHEKIERIARTSVHQDIRALAGIPSWFQTLLTRVLELTGKKHLREIWPRLEAFFHGGIHYHPYREGFERMAGGPLRTLAVYNATEGFFGLADRPGKEEFLLALDHATYYEFIPTDRFQGTASTDIRSLAQVEKDVEYAPVITNASGLWRYIIGDTLRFTSVRPYRFVLTGRTTHFLNIVGEELSAFHTEKAVAEASRLHGAEIDNYTVAPIFMQGTRKAAHEWVIEFRHPPRDLSAFVRDLDRLLRQFNSDYDIKRQKNISLDPPLVHAAPRGLFEKWLAAHGKLGGQHKVPRLLPRRDTVEELLAMMEQMSN
ncbi:MAG: GH3 auxin-responsive promoter family protein [Chlorobi bacterium]|nr:GH3 auxin-responsive promoter family protein [Chlorobiota bacterium]